jgi:hypothetical protein
MQTQVITVPAGMRVAVSELERDLARLPADVDTIVFVSGGNEPLLPTMLERFETSGADALVAVTPVHEAAKEVRHGVVQAGMDRTDLVTVAGAEIVARAALAAAVDDMPLDQTVDPAAIVATLGGRVLPHPVRSRD